MRTPHAIIGPSSLYAHSMFRFERGNNLNAGRAFIIFDVQRCDDAPERLDSEKSGGAGDASVAAIVLHNRGFMPTLALHFISICPFETLESLQPLGIVLAKRMLF
jgi:hypothetical protein